MYTKIYKRSIAVCIPYGNRSQGASGRGRVHVRLLLDGVSMVMSVEECVGLGRRGLYLLRGSTLWFCKRGNSVAEVRVQ